MLSLNRALTLWNNRHEHNRTYIASTWCTERLLLIISIITRPLGLESVCVTEWERLGVNYQLYL